MAQPTGESQGRGRKPADSWSYKKADDTVVKVKITIPSLDEFTKAQQAEFAEIGLRQAARSTFQREMKEIESKVETNRELVALAKASFDKGPKLDKFLAGIVSEFPTSWEFGGDIEDETEETEE